MPSYFSKIAITLCLLGLTLTAQDVSATEHAKTPVLDKQKRLREMAKKYADEHRFIASIGTAYSAFKDKSSATSIKGNSKAAFIVFGYQFTQKFSANLVFIKSKSNSREPDDSLKVKSIDDTISTSFDYKILQWLTLDFSFQSKNGTITTTMPSQPNVNAKSKNVYRTPSLSLKMIFPVSPKIFVAPDIGLSRTYMFNKAYVDNTGKAQPKKSLTLDQMSVGTKVGFLLNAMVIPYVSAGYSRTLHYSAHLKSRDSTRGGAGLLLCGGIAALDWTASKANKSVTSNSFSFNLTAKF